MPLFYEVSLHEKEVALLDKFPYIFRERSEGDGDGLAIVVHHLALGVVEVQRLRSVGGDEDDVEATLFKHAGERASALRERNGARGIVVGNVDGGILSALVIVVGTLVLVKLELTVLSGIDVEVDEVGGFLVAPLHGGAEGDDGTLADEDGNAFVGSIDDELTG